MLEYGIEAEEARELFHQWRTLRALNRRVRAVCCLALAAVAITTRNCRVGGGEVSACDDRFCWNGG